MAIERKDRVKDTTTTTGTGTVTLTGTAPSGYRSVSAAHTDGATVRYAISAGAEWEVGEGIYTASGTTLSRASVLASSNAGALVNFSAGTKDVITTLTAGEVDGLVKGPASATDNSLARFDGTTGKLLKDGAVIGTDVASLAANTFTGIQRWAKGADVASANALTLGTDGNYFDITGTTAITSIGTLGAGTWVKLHFDGALTLTHHATDLILPGAANITTAAGDEAEFVEYATGDWRCTNYVLAAFVPSVVGQATAEAGTDTAPRLWTAERVAQAIAALGGGGITLGTPVASTSGTSIDFTGIPATAKRITINFSGVSTTGTSDYIVQIGDAGGIEATGYLGACGYTGASSLGANYTTGFGVVTNPGAPSVVHGSCVLTLEKSAANTWCSASVLANSTGAYIYSGAGAKSLSATFDRVRITTVGGANTFDAGEINISYE